MTENTVYLPQEVYHAVKERAAELRRTPDDLVTEWVLEHVPPPVQEDIYKALESEWKAFEKLRPELQEQYPGQYVAIYQERVVGMGEDQFDLLKQVYDEFGQVVCFIDKPDGPPIRKARITSTWVVRQ